MKYCKEYLFNKLKVKNISHEECKQDFNTQLQNMSEFDKELVFIKNKRSTKLHRNTLRKFILLKVIKYTKLIFDGNSN